MSSVSGTPWRRRRGWKSRIRWQPGARTRRGCKREPTRLNERGFDAIRFRGPGTDLTIGLVPEALWRCAAFETAHGITHVPNLPTEEVFTSPDWRRADGYVRSTYPLVTSGTKVTGLEFRFENGRIVDVRAESGAEILRAQLAVDEQAPYLGEVALVDGSSPVKQTGLVFSDTLFDENATCHIAFGAGIPEILESSVPQNELLDAGINVSGDPHGLHDRRRGGRRRRPRHRR